MLSKLAMLVLTAFKFSLKLNSENCSWKKSLTLCGSRLQPVWLKYWMVQFLIWSDNVLFESIRRICRSTEFALITTRNCSYAFRRSGKTISSRGLRKENSKVHRKMLGHPYSTCVKNDSNFLTYFPVYTEDRCLHECLANVVVGVCNCLPQDWYLEQISLVALISFDISWKYLLPGHEVVKCTLLDHAVCISKLLKLFEYRNCIFELIKSANPNDMGNIMQPIKWLWMHSSLFDTKSSWSNGSIWEL